MRSAGDVDATFEPTLKMRNSPIWNVRAHQKVSVRFQKVGPRRVRRPNAWAAGEKRLATPAEEDSTETRAADSAMKLVPRKFPSMEKILNTKLSQVQAIADMFSKKMDEVTELKSKVAATNDRLKKLEKSPRTTERQSNDIIVTNIPPFQKEDTIRVAEAVLEGLAADVKKEEILQASRFEVEKDGRTRYFIKIRMANDEAKGRSIKAATAAKVQLKERSASSGPRRQLGPRLWTAGSHGREHRLQFFRLHGNSANRITAGLRILPPTG